MKYFSISYEAEEREEKKKTEFGFSVSNMFTSFTCKMQNKFGV